MWKVPEGKVLLLGDGNFSFARSYSDLLNPTKTFITGYDSAEEFDGKYKSEGADNVEFLKQRGFTVLHEVDATDIRKTPQLSQLSFDLIIFNFPHPGGKTNLKKCRYLLKNTFISCAEVLSADGRLFITLAEGQSGLTSVGCDHIDELKFRNCPKLHEPDSWQLAYLASYGGFVIAEVTEFSNCSFPGYNSSGFRSSSKQFNTYKAETFILIKVASATVSSELAEDETNLLSPLRPYYTHDISFWSEPRAFSEKEFFATVKCLSANLVKFAYLLDKYPSGANQQLESRCYRLIYSCNNYSLTRENCGELQLRLRSQLSSHYDQMQNVQFCLR